MKDRLSFLEAFGLPDAWAARPQWCILDSALEDGERFLATWHAWKADSRRPRLLHYVVMESAALGSADWQRRRAAARTAPELASLAHELQLQCFGLLPGFHRLAFEGGHVLLTICVGETRAQLREQPFEADAVYLADRTGPADATPWPPGSWDLWTCKALARRCRRGTVLLAEPDTAAAAHHQLTQVGFVSHRGDGPPAVSGRPKSRYWHGIYDPAWTPKRRVAQGSPVASRPASLQPGRCAVIGAGLSGAAVAASLARRGWQVDVLDSAPGPAAGASGLPAGLLAPHTSPDDGVLSRLSRSGVRLMLQQARVLLREGVDWQHTGLLEHRVDGRITLPAAWDKAGRDWSTRATARQLALAELDSDTPALWHTQAAWIKPARLVSALLSHPGIAWHGNVPVAALAPLETGWQALGADGQVLATPQMVVIAAGFASRILLEAAAGAPPALQAIRGQISYGVHPPGSFDLPPFPVNGNGHLTPHVPFGFGTAWFVGASYERDNADTSWRPEDHDANLRRLEGLLPKAAQQLQAEFSSKRVQAWVGVRCAAPDHLPLVGPTQRPNLWVCTAMGSRGLSLAVLCAELLAAQLHGEPLPIEQSLARRLRASRFTPATP